MSSVPRNDEHFDEEIYRYDLCKEHSRACLEREREKLRMMIFSRMSRESGQSIPFAEVMLDRFDAEDRSRERQQEGIEREWLKSVRREILPLISPDYVPEEDHRHFNLLWQEALKEVKWEKRMERRNAPPPVILPLVRTSTSKDVRTA